MFHHSVFAQLPAYAPTSGIIAYYPLDGDATDHSGNNLDGVISGASKSIDSKGNVDAAYYFDGVNANIDLGGSTKLNPDSGITIITRFRIERGTSKTTLRTLIGRNGGGTSSFGYALLTDHKTSTVNAEWAPSLPGGSLSDQKHLRNAYGFQPNRWYTLTATYSAKTGIQNLYVNDQLVASDTFGTYTLNQINERTYIGGFRDVDPNGYHHPFKGDIEYMYLYDRALSSTEITNFYNGSISDTCTVVVYDTISVADTLVVNTTLSTGPPAVLNTLKLFPNPSKTNVTIDVGDPSKLSGYYIEITDMQGKQMFHSVITNKTYSVDISSWAVGTYNFFLRNSQSGVVERRMIVKQ